ncbi:MAG: nitrile hydratase accessory protein [Gammaproteobacteria bacterium]|nr:nitrile hydratase accessory protein [Gammaproteobacteria bacterium]
MTSELGGIEQPPMANGELLFEAPWQGRVFGMARALSEAGLYTWDEFREYLIKAIAGWERESDSDYAYYDHFLAALESLLADKGLVPSGPLEARCSEFRNRPHGHDH